MSDAHVPPVPPLFEAVSHFSDPQSDPSGGLIGRTWDITAGVRLVLEVIERDEMNIDNGQTPVLDSYQRGVLMRMTISSLGMLAHEADRFILEKNLRSVKAASEPAAKPKEAKHA